MANFKSDVFTLNASGDVLKTFLTVPANFKEILPEDRIADWKSDDEGCSFMIQGLAHINIKLQDSSKENQVEYKSIDDRPFPFTLMVLFNQNGQGTKVSAEIEAEVNCFMKLMLDQPLTSFLNSLGKTIKEKFDEN